MKIGNNIRKLRELKNYTQAYLAERLGLSLGAYGRIERDETDITLSKIKLIAEILETDVITILSFDTSSIFGVGKDHKNFTSIIEFIKSETGTSKVSEILHSLNNEIIGLKLKIEKLEGKR